MKAVYFVGEKQAEIREIPVPVPKKDEYLIHIDACGICGSDVEGFLGKTGRRIPPMIMGHECAGTIKKTPEGGKLSPGTRVAIFPKFYCGECPTCLSGKVNICPNADFLGVMDFDGAMTEYVCAKEQYLIPYEGDDAAAASMTEPAAVSYNAIDKLTDEEIKNAENILLIGAGTIGLLALLWLKYRGAGRVIVSDASEYRRKLSEKLGADLTIDPLSCADFEKKISEVTDGKMCDISVEAVGISPTAQNSIEALKPSGIAVWVGNASKMVSINMQYVVTKEIEIRGNYIYTAENFEKCVHLLSQKAIDVEPVISEHMPMEKGAEAFNMLINNKDGRLVKIILEN